MPIKRLASSPAPSFVYGHLSLGGAKKHCLMTSEFSLSLLKNCRPLALKRLLPISDTLFLFQSPIRDWLSQDCGSSVDSLCLLSSRRQESTPKHLGNEHQHWGDYLRWIQSERYSSSSLSLHQQCRPWSSQVECQRGWKDILIPSSQDPSNQKLGR